MGLLSNPCFSSLKNLPTCKLITTTTTRLLLYADYSEFTINSDRIKIYY